MTVQNVLLFHMHPVQNAYGTGRSPLEILQIVNPPMLLRKLNSQVVRMMMSAASSQVGKTTFNVQNEIEIHTYKYV